MKFKSDSDKELLLNELATDKDLCGLTLEDLESPSIQSAIAVKRRGLLKKLKNFRKSQTQKQNWRKGKHKYLKGIRQFHKSVTGKRFHRSLARFVTSRGILKKPHKKSSGLGSDRLRESLQFQIYEYNKVTLNRYDQSELLSLLTATKNHLILETKYFLPMSEEVDHLVMLEIVLPELTEVCTKLEMAIINYDEFILDEDEVSLIDSILGSNYYENLCGDKLNEESE